MLCKICQTPTQSFDDIERKKRYFQCPHCECIMLDPADYISAEAENTLYGFHHNSLENEGYVAMFENFLDFFWDELQVKQTALDFGSGPTPVLSYLMERRGVVVDCYDKFYQPIPCYTDKTYDFMTSTEVFEHLSEPKEVLSMLSEHLNRGSVLALMTLFHHNDTAHFLTWWYRRDPTHIVFYTPKSLEILAEKCGMKLIKTDGKRIAILEKR